MFFRFMPIRAYSRPTGFPIMAIPRDDGDHDDFGNPPHPLLRFLLSSVFSKVLVLADC
jgi:hypothetical protein